MAKYPHSTKQQFEDGLTDALSLALSQLSAGGERQLPGQLAAGFGTNAPNEASAAIRSFLDTKSDRATEQGFKVNATGHLDQAPTLRTFLLDELATTFFIFLSKKWWRRRELNPRP